MKKSYGGKGHGGKGSKGNTGRAIGDTGMKSSKGNSRTHQAADRYK